MKVSVIIPTYNGAHKLPDILVSVHKQTIKPDEVIVAVDGSTDNTLTVLEDLQLTLFAFKIVYSENAGRAAIRNYGAKVATGDLLVFFDDDMLPVCSCLEKHVAHHVLHQRTILTGAQIDVGTKDKTDIQQYKSALSLLWTMPLKQHNLKPLNKEQIFLTAANFSIGKVLFEQLGGFDERLMDAEDFDLAVRAHHQKIALYFDYSAFAWHNDEITGMSYVRRLRQYRKAHQTLRDLKPEIYNGIQQHIPALPKGIKEKVYHFFATKFWIEWLDKKSWKTCLPKKLRYKLYDLIITANGVYYPEIVSL